MIDNDDLRRIIAELLKEAGIKGGATSFIYHRIEGGGQGLNDDDSRPSSNYESNNQGDYKDETRTLRFSQDRRPQEGQTTVYVQVQVPRSWVRFIVSSDQRGFMVREARQSRQKFRVTYRNDQGYTYHDHSYRKGVLTVRFINPRYEAGFTRRILFG